jgi:hypothetical protein
MSEILNPQWAWVDLANRRVVWPDSKTGGMSKPMSAEAIRLFETAPRLEQSPYVCPCILDPNLPMSRNTYYGAWRRILTRAELSHVGTHPASRSDGHRQFRYPLENRHGAHRP